MTISVDTFPGRTFRGRVAAVSPGTGAQFAILPPQNASGNWVKVVQRVPVRIEFAPNEDVHDLRAGMSVTVDIDTGRQNTRRSSALGLHQQGRGAAPMTGAAARLPAGARRALLTVCTMTATIMQALDTTIANVALPYMQGSLSASLDQISWVLTSYIVAAAVMTAPVGWLADRFGRKKLFIVCVAGFTFASLLCALSQNIEQIVAFRLLQGMCGAALVPLSQSVMLDAYPIEQRGQAMGIWGMGVMLGPIMGPTLGGWLTENYSWHWVFLVNLPVGILTVLGLLVFMDETKRAGAPALRLVRLPGARGRHRRPATDARPRRAARLVRARPRSSPRLIVSIVGFYYFFAHSLTTRRAVRALRDLPRPQLPDRLLLHGDHGADAVLLDGAGRRRSSRTSWAIRSSPPAGCSPRAASARWSAC